jgi:hypothetical protein
MLSKCVNPNCSTPFVYLRDGKLFRWDGWGISHHEPDITTSSASGKPTRKLEYFWLCGDCAASMTVVFREGIGVTVRTFAKAYQAVS